MLISRLSALGDVVCTLPVASAIKKEWPDAEIVWVTDKRSRGVLECCTAVDTIVERPSRPSVIRALGQFDAALDMQGLFKSGILVGLAKAKQRLGYHWQREGSWLFSQRVLPDPTSLHVVDQYVDVARAVGATTDAAEFALAPLAEDVVSVEAKLKERGWDGRTLVVCNAGAGWSTKRWGADRFALLCDKLSAEGCAVAFLGAPADRATFDEVKSAGALNALDMVGETSVRELVALVSLATVHVGGDTGSTHIAAAQGRPAVGIYPVTRPERSCPYGQFENTLAGNPEVDQVLVAVQRVVSKGTP